MGSSLSRVHMSIFLLLYRVINIIFFELGAKEWEEGT